MAKQKKAALYLTRAQAEGSQQNPAKSWVAIIERLGESFIQGFFDLLGKFGLAGIILLIMYYFMNTNATEGQKQEIIDMWVLFKGENPEKMSTLVVVGIAMIVIGGQWVYHMKRVRMQREEISRLIAEKRIYQSLAIGRKKNNKKRKKK